MISKSIRVLIQFCSLGLFIMALSSSADARNCKKGKPCGNSCIAQADVCHKDSASSAPSNSAPAKMDPVPSEPKTWDKSAPKGEPQDARKGKTCTKGKACGNSCIPADAVCHQ